LSKIVVGGDSRPVTLLDSVTESSTRWSPDGLWVSTNTEKGFFLVSPDGAVKRKISDEKFLVHAWAPDSSGIYGIRLDDDLHLVLERLTVDGKQSTLADLGTSPPATIPLDGFSLSPDGKVFLAGLVKTKGDLWILEGFDEQLPWWRRVLHLR
jgi:hypothetical protein